MEITRRTRRFAAGMLVLSLLAPGAGAAVNQSPESHHEFYENAARHFSEGELAAAVIELKNALQRSPGHVPSRVLLGRTHLRLGNASAAEKELTLALHYGADETLVLVPLGNALLLQRKHEAILERVRSLDPVLDASAEILSIRGQALLELGRLDEAQDAFRSASWAAPGHAEPLLGLASVLMAQQRPDEAEKLIDEAARHAPDDEEVWFRKAQVRLLAGDREQAARLLDRTLDRNPAHLRARLARASLRMQQGDAEGARSDADHVLSLVPEDAHAALLSAQANARLGDGAEAKAAFARAAERIALINPEFLWRNPAALSLAGKISFVQRDFEQVNHYLTRYVSIRPRGSALARKLLGRARLEIGDAKGAADVLGPLVREQPDDVEALVLLGDAWLQARIYLQAASVFERAVELAANDPKVLTRLALSRMGTGRTMDALASLEEAFALDSTSLRTGLLLAFTHLRRGEVGEAERTAAALVERYPDNPVTVNLNGVVLRSTGRTAAARDAFMRAWELDRGFEPALFNLADLELRAGDTAAAARHFQAVLEFNPRSARALIGLSDIERQEGRPFQAIGYLKKAIALAPDAVQPYVRLIDHQLDADQTEDALRTAHELAERHTDDATVLQELARTQLATGLRSDAMRTLREASRYAGYAGQELLRIGQLQITVGDYEGARWTLQKALETDQRNAANAALARLDLTSGNLAGALEFTAGLIEREPDNPVAHLLHGEVLTQHRRLDEAVAAYERSLQLGPTSDAAVGLFEVLVSAGRQADAFALLERWVEEHPGDLTVKRALGLGYIAANRMEPAQAVHEALEKALPDDPLVLNNLARIYQITGDPRARAYAERAVGIAPEWAIALDTLGWIHVTEGRPAEGLPLLRNAQARAARNPVIRFHLATALGKLGRNREAVAQLDHVLTTAGTPDWIDEVKALRETLAEPDSR